MHQNQNNEIPNPIAELQKKLKQAEKIISALMYRVEKSSLIYESDYSYFESIAILNETIDKTQEKINQITQELYEKESKLEQIERELRAKEEHLNEILYFIDDIVWSVSYPIMKLLYVNKAVEKVYGIEIENLSKMNNLWFGLIHPDDLNIFYNAIARLEDTPQLEVVYRINRLDGQIRYILDKLTRKIDKNGRIYQIDGIARDITDLKQAQMQTEISMQQYQMIFESVVEGIVIIDTNATVVAINQSACKMFGYKKGELIGKKAELFLSSDLLKKLFDNYYSNVLNYEFFVESSERKKNGEEFIVELFSRKFKLNYENFIICSLINITNRKEVDRALLQQQQALAESERKLNAILNNTRQSFVLLNTNYNIIAFNKSFEKDVKKFFGIELDNTKRIYEIFPAHLKDLLFEKLLKAFGGESSQVELEIPATDGHFEKFIYFIDPVRREDNQIESLVVSSINLTQLFDKTD
ncbi:MAG: PAS domain S-box protein [Ignavibacteria bacterium]|nr:PAS domain S-box protein [Ignavibacteria bacterium]